MNNFTENLTNRQSTHEKKILTDFVTENIRYQHLNNFTEINSEDNFVLFGTVKA